MSKNKIIWIVVLVIVVVVAIFIITNNSSTTQTSTTSASLETTNPNATASTSKTYSMTEVAQHNSMQSCWSAINNKVYDLSTWISQHPGGPEAILSLCGKDGSAAFNDQHGGEARPANELAGFLIGDLQK